MHAQKLKRYRENGNSEIEDLKAVWESQTPTFRVELGV